MGLITLIVIIVIASSVSSIIKAMLSSRGRRMPPADRDALKRIEESLLQVRDEVSALRGDVDELQERVDFTERVLARNREGELRLGPP